MEPPDRSPRILIGGGGNGAGIQNHELRGSGPDRPFQTAFLELALDCGPVGLGCPATKILYVETSHPSIVT